MKRLVSALLLLIMLSTLGLSMAVELDYITIGAESTYMNAIDEQTIADQGMRYWIVDLNIQNKGNQPFIVDTGNFIATVDDKNYTIDSATFNLASLGKDPLMSDITLNAKEQFNGSLAFMIPIVDTQVGNTRPKLSYVRGNLPIIWNVKTA
jgi:hypothetical protein